MLDVIDSIRGGMIRAAKNPLQSLVLLMPLVASYAEAADPTCSGVEQNQGDFCKAFTKGGHRVEPYMDVMINGDWQNNHMNTTYLEQLKSCGADGVRLAFLVSDNGACAVKWGGQMDFAWTDPAKESGLDVTISFGGAIGTYIEKACTTDDALKEQIDMVLEKTEATGVDFDIEGAAIQDLDSAKRLARVLKKVQDENPDLRISLTLPVLPTGLDPDGEEIVKIMQDNGLENLQINPMTMDFGSAIADMGEAVINAYQSLIKQIGNYSAAITPMIGVQDSANETFTLKDAEAVTAQVPKDVPLSFWSVARDDKCNWADEQSSQTRYLRGSR